MKVFILFFVLFQVSANCIGHEWYQLTESGLTHRSVVLKPSVVGKEKINFDDLLIEQKSLSNDEAKKFNLKTPQKLVFIGDTGCRLKDGKAGVGGEYQDCEDKKAWPFWEIVEKIDAEKSDLIIHLGDFHYREKCTHGPLCEKIKETGYGWIPWELDFFKPMELAFKHTPIVIVRGNHEDCERAFQGYKLMIANEQWSSECKVKEDGQILELGDLVLVNIDSSAIDDKPELSQSLEKEWIEYLNNIEKRLAAKNQKNVWIITHKPVYGLAPFLKNYMPLNINFRKYLEKSKLISRVRYIFSGHVHTSMIVKTKGRPTQIVLGDGGTKLTDMSEKINENMLKFFQYDSVDVVQLGFGYATITKSPKNKNWTLNFKNAEANTVKSMDLD